MRRVRDPIRLSLRRPRTTDLIAHFVEPATDVFDKPPVNARGWRRKRRLLIACERASARPDIRVRPRVAIAPELGRQELAEQPPVLGTQHLVIHEHAALVDEQRRDLGHIWTAIIHDVKTRLLAADSPGAVEEAAAALARGDLVAPRRGTRAFRVPDHPLARRLIAASGGGLPVTSANRSGEPDARTAQEVIAQLEGRIALVLDGGTTPGGVSSTVVDCTTDQIKILRQGAISVAEIESVLAGVV